MCDKNKLEFFSRGGFWVRLGGSQRNKKDAFSRLTTYKNYIPEKKAMSDNL